MSDSSIDNAITFIHSNNAQENVNTLLTLIQKVFQGILDQPNNEALRKFNPTKPSFQNSFGTVKGSIDLLTTVGYQIQYDNKNQMERIYFPSSASLDPLKVCINRISVSMTSTDSDVTDKTKLEEEERKKKRRRKKRN